MRTTLCLLTSCVLLLPASPAAGQDRSWSFGFGYAMNAPEQLVGVSAHVIPAGLPIGVYADVKLDMDSPAGSAHVLDVTPAFARDEYGDIWLDTERRWRTVNAGLLMRVGRELRLYAGAGYTDYDGYARFFDPTGERGDFGNYWVANPDDEGATVNVLAGGYFRFARALFVQFGVETEPRGFTVGLSYITPRG